MNLIWITEDKNAVPEEKVMEDIQELLKEQIDELVKCVKGTGELSLFVEMKPWFLRLGFINHDMGNCLIQHYDQDTWLDMIKKEQESTADSYWASEKDGL